MLNLLRMFLALENVFGSVGWLRKTPQKAIRAEMPRTKTAILSDNSICPKKKLSRHSGL